MRERLAAALGADQSCVNVKASSPEGIGALGRGDGMAAAAIVMLEAD
jgi:2-C-methyl-D-erythritol 2,4-cyclodiphosphate synthase